MQKKITLFLSIILVGCTFVACNGTQPDDSINCNPTEESEIPSDIVSTEKQLIESSYVVNEFEPATISNIFVSENVITLQFTYNGEHQLNLGHWFVLEIYKNGTWYTLPYDIENSWELEAYPVEPNQSRSMEYNWKYIYEPLSAGKYRIVTKVMDFIETGNYTNYYLAAEFEIK